MLKKCVGSIPTRATARVAPTIHGLAKPIRRIVGATLAVSHAHQLKKGRVCSAKSENFCRGCRFLLVVGNCLLLRASVRCSCCFRDVCVDPRACAGRIWTAASATPPRLPLSSQTTEASVGPAGKRAALLVPGSCLLALTSAAASLSPTQ